MQVGIAEFGLDVLIREHGEPRGVVGGVGDGAERGLYPLRNQTGITSRWVRRESPGTPRVAAVIRAEGLLARGGRETFGRPGGKVARPCHNLRPFREVITARSYSFYQSLMD